MNLPVTFQVLLFLCSLSAVVWACPNGCKCVQTDVDCTSLTDFPTDVPSATTQIHLYECSFDTLKPEDLNNFSDALRNFLIRDTLLKEVHPGAFNSTLNISVLGLTGTEVQDLPEHLFQRLQKLETLVLKFNKLSVIRSQWFFLLTELKHLDLSKNIITSVPAKTFHPLTKLQYLSLSRNSINQLLSETFKGLVELKTLRLNKNLLKDLPAGSFNDLVNLDELSLQDNLITHLQYDLFSKNLKLRKLFLSNNRLTSLPQGIFFSMPLLSQISLYENHLESLGPGIFGPMPLQELWLYDNRLSRLEDDTFMNLTQLHLLVLSRNEISYISKGAFRGLNHLGEVSLHTNRLTTLQAGTFKDLPNLVNISLEHNFISSLPLGLLKGLHHLGQIELQNNSLPNLSQENLNALFVAQKILLHQNPWRCDKDILPLRDWLKQHPSKVNQTLVLCETPFNLNGETIATLSDEDLMLVNSTKEPVLTSSVKRRIPSTFSPKQSTSPSDVNATPTAEIEQVTSSGKADGGIVNNPSIILIAIAVVATTVISSIIGCVCWRRNKTGKANIGHRNKNAVL